MTLPKPQAVQPPVGDRTEWVIGMPIVISPSLLNQVDWGLSYFWNVRWTGIALSSSATYDLPDGQFASWFPASTIDEDIAAVESYTFHARGGSWKVPFRRGIVRQIRMSFYDDEDNTLLDWFDQWINGSAASTDPASDPDTVGIFDRAGTRVSPIKDCVRQLEVNRLNSDGTTGNNVPREYWVYPDGLITFHGNSSSEARVFSVTLIIAGGSETTLT